MKPAAGCALRSACAFAVMPWGPFSRGSDHERVFVVVFLVVLTTSLFWKSLSQKWHSFVIAMLLSVGVQPRASLPRFGSCQFRFVSGSVPFRFCKSAVRLGSFHNERFLAIHLWVMRLVAVRFGSRFVPVRIIVGAVRTGSVRTVR